MATTKIDTDALTSDIIHAITHNNALKIRLLLAGIGELPDRKQAKVLREIFNHFMLKSYTFIRNFSGYLRRNHSIVMWKFDTETFRVILVDRLTRALMELEEKGKFKPRKVSTIRKIPMSLLTMEPKNLEYLLKSGIIVLSPTFMITKGQSSMNQLLLTTFRYLSRGSGEVVKLKELCDIYGIDPDLFLNIRKKKLIGLTRMKNNLEIIGEIVAEKIPVDKRRGKYTDLQSVIEREKSYLFREDFKVLSCSTMTYKAIINSLEGGINYQEISDDEYFRHSTSLYNDYSELYRKFDITTAEVTEDKNDCEITFEPAEANFDTRGKF